MLTEILLVAHIVVLGYWLGSEFVINSTYKYVCYGADMPFPARDKLMAHVMHVDQHVRYALVMQAGLGVSLAALYGFVPGGETVVAIALAATVLWLGFVEITHRLRLQPIGQRLGAIDRGSRYVLMAILIGTALGLIGGDWDMPNWLRLKLALFAGVMASGVGIRIALIGHFRTWAIMARDGVTDAHNKTIKQTYWNATYVLYLLWVFIAGIVVLSVWKPF